MKAAKIIVALAALAGLALVSCSRSTPSIPAPTVPISVPSITIGK